MAKDLEVSMNSEEGLQIEWRGILLTIRVNPHHGIYGSIAEMDGKNVRMLEFHGKGPGQLFPVHLHETSMDASGKKK